MTRHRLANIIALISLTTIFFISGYGIAYAIGVQVGTPKTEAFVPMSEVAKGLSFKGTLP